MAATYVFDLPKQMIEQAGGLEEGDVIRYVGAGVDTDVVMVIGVQTIALLNDRDIFRITAALLPESRAGEAKLEAKVKDDDSLFPMPSLDPALKEGLDG